MKIIAPITITDAIMTVSNVAETDYTAWSASVVYAAGDYTMYVAANVHKLYVSNAGAASAVTMTIASPCVVTWTGALPIAGTPVSFTTTGALPTGLVVGTIYYVLVPTGSTFNVAATVGGAAINTSGSQSGVHTARASNNVNHNPYTDPSTTNYWTDAGATNRWKLHDQSVQSQTQNATSIANTYVISGRCNSVAAMNLDSASMTVTMTDVNDGLVYNKTTSLTSKDGIDNFYSWLFSPIVRVSDIAFTDLPSYSNATITVTFSVGSGNAYVGGLVFGTMQNIGSTQYGMKLSFQSYSSKTVDAFGNMTITKRAYRKLGDFSVMVNSTYVDQVQKLLTTYRDTPIVCIGAGAYSSDLMYGFFKDSAIVVSYPTTALLSITFEGLT